MALFCALAPGGSDLPACTAARDQGPNYAETAALTACSGILGHDGFLLRTDGHCSGVYSYDYYWFDTAGDLQVLTARMDPVALDLDGDGTAELAWEIAEWQGAFSFYFGGQTAPSVV